MRYDFHIKVSNIDSAINFYVNELGLFEKGFDYGMGNVLLRNIDNSSFCLLLKEEEGYQSSNAVLFTIGVNDARGKFQRFGAISFERGAGVVAFENMDSFIEYPLGKTFTLRDPDGNRFSICEWHENAL